MYRNCLKRREEVVRTNRLWYWRLVQRPSSTLLTLTSDPLSFYLLCPVLLLTLQILLMISNTTEYLKFMSNSFVRIRLTISKGLIPYSCHRCMQFHCSTPPFHSRVSLHSLLIRIVGIKPLSKIFSSRLYLTFKLVQGQIPFSSEHQRYRQSHKINCITDMHSYSLNPLQHSRAITLELLLRRMCSSLPTMVIME